MAVKITDEHLTFDLEDGRKVSVPLSFYPPLQLATPRERKTFEICRLSAARREGIPQICRTGLEKKDEAHCIVK